LSTATWAWIWRWRALRSALVSGAALITWKTVSMVTDPAAREGRTCGLPSAAAWVAEIALGSVRPAPFLTRASSAPWPWASTHAAAVPPSTAAPAGDAGPRVRARAATAPMVARDRRERLKAR
jgi:hypothetical protein